MTADERMEKVLIDHQRKNAESCLCGWSKWGASHAAHQWKMLKLAGARVSVSDSSLLAWGEHLLRDG